MRIDVGPLLKATTGETRTYRVDGWELVVDGGNREKVDGGATLLRTQAGVLASVHASLRTHDACSRCLQEVDIPLEVSFEEEYVPTVDVFTGGPLPPPEDPGTFVIDSEQVLDLSEAVRQYRE